MFLITYLVKTQNQNVFCSINNYTQHYHCLDSYLKLGPPLSYYHLGAGGFLCNKHVIYAYALLLSRVHCFLCIAFFTIAAHFLNLKSTFYIELKMLNNCKNRYINVISFGAFKSWWINNRRADDQGPCIPWQNFHKNDT